jgi:hypothetical protein
MNDHKGTSRGHGLHLAVLLVAAAVALVRLIRIGSEFTKPDFWLVGAFALLAMAVMFFALIVVPARRARNSAATVRAERPGAVVLTTYWATPSTAFFLKPGPLVRNARGRGFYVQVIVDENGVELRRPLRNTSFGVIPWSAVRDVRLDELRGPFTSRPKLVFEIADGAAPYAEYFELLPEGKDERSRAAEYVAAILVKRRAAGNVWSGSSAGQVPGWKPLEPPASPAV